MYRYIPIISSQKRTFLGTSGSTRLGSTYTFDGMGHGMSARAAQGEVQHHNLISGNESRDTHNKDQVSEED